MSGSISPAQPIQPASALEIPNPVRIPGHVPLRGIAMMLGATLFFASTDTITKTLTGALPAVEIAWLRYATFALVATTALLRGGGGAALRSQRPTIQILRGFAMVASALLFTLGLRFISVAEATAIYFVSPILITALAIPVLGERIGWRSWTAALSGLVGVLIVIRPGTGAFDSAALFPLLGATCRAGAAVVTRKVSTADRPVTTMVYSAFVGLLVLSALLPFNWVAPSSTEVRLGICIGLLSTAGHWLVVLAYRDARASLIAPYAYVQLIWAALLGYAVFGSLPDAFTLAGAAVIVLSGFYTANRERVGASARQRERQSVRR